MATTAPVERKVSAATAGAYLASTGLIASLTAVQDHHELVSWMPGSLTPFVFALVPAFITFAAGWSAKHTPQPTDPTLG